MSGPILLGLRVLAALALYGFLGWALYLTWRTLRALAETQQSQKPVPLSVSIDTEHSIGEVMLFKQSEVLIGRDSDCSIRLADSTVSAQHARFIYHHNQWWVEDMGSRNGTMLNDDPLTMPTVIVNGDTIDCGRVKLTVQLNNETEASPKE